MAGRYRDVKTPGPDVHPPMDTPAPIPTIRILIQRAAHHRLWLFDPSDKAWYTPEEFEMKFGRIVSGNERWLATIQVRDPFEGVRAGYQRLLDTQVKLEDFTKKVIEYYREDPTTKK